MIRQFLVGLVIAGAALAAGITFNDQHYRLDVPTHPADEIVIAHRDSPYTGMTWVESASNNYRQLRFFDRVEGGVCLEPSWAVLAAMPGLEHLRPASGITATGQGTLNNSPYISFFPAGLLLNRDVPKAPRVLIVGLGSGVGIAQVAHHFSQAEIDVVDIDPAVVDMVRAHFPLLAWLEQQRRLKFIVSDARAYVRSQKGHGYHMAVLDAYTAGSTIPPHLMTREFFAQVADTLADGGVVLANVIGCYGKSAGTHGEIEGFAHRVLGGALRSMRAAGLPHAWCIPVLRESDDPTSFAKDEGRNTIVVAAKHDLSPRGFAAGWERLQEWKPFPELKTGQYISRHVVIIEAVKEQGMLKHRYASTCIPLEWVEPAVPQLVPGLKPFTQAPTAPQHTQLSSTNDRVLIEAVAAAARKHGGLTNGWNVVPAEAELRLRTIDWTLFPRETWRASIAFARDASVHDPEMLVGPVDGPERDNAIPSWHMLDAPLFTDQTPNADIMNH